MKEPPALLQAKLLTSEQHTHRVQAAFTLEAKIKAATSRAHALKWELAEALYEFDQLRGWELLGHDTVGEFLAQPDLGLGKRSYFDLVRLWRDLITIKELPIETARELHPSKATEVIPAVMAGKVSLEDAVDDVKELSWRDVKEKYRPENIARHGQQPDNSTPLAAEEEPVRVPCPTCGQWTTEDRLPQTLNGEASEVEA